MRREIHNLSIHPLPNSRDGTANVATGSANAQQGAAGLAGELRTFIPHKGPFSLFIHQDITPQGFKMPVKLLPYEPKIDLIVHLRAFNVAVQTASVSEGKKCKLFPTTLGQEELNWYACLPDYSISSFEEVEIAFLRRFATSIIYKNLSNFLATLEIKTS